MQKKITTIRVSTVIKGCMVLLNIDFIQQVLIDKF